jgi:hypothetical protein
MNFQRIVLYVASVLLILTLAFIGYLLYQAKSNTAYPPEISECPDYWKVTGLLQCENVQNLGNGTCEKMKDFSSVEWQGQSGMKKKKEWANMCGVVWDGITNNEDL